FSGNKSDHLDALKGFHRRQWEHTLTWLHDAGLALYFLQKLKDRNATDVLPRSALSRLEQNLTANRCRVAYMSRQFTFLNQEFEAFVPHAVELHLAFWYSDAHGVVLAEPEFSVDHGRTHQWQGSDFRALSEEDAFLLQVIHAFNHVLTGWVQMSWLYEIGYFL